MIEKENEVFCLYWGEEHLLKASYLMGSHELRARRLWAPGSQRGPLDLDVAPENGETL